MTADEQPRGQARRGDTAGSGQAGAPKRRPSPRPRPQSDSKPAAAPEAKPARPEAGTAEEAPPPAAAADAAELQALRGEVDERTRDLQRVTAEYANYRKRVDRDRGLVAEQATGSLLAALLPVLDDFDRARDHGDLVGPFGAVAEQVNVTLAKFGLTPFGEVGDAFDPMRHEAVAHSLSPEVTEPTCVDVMRRGYLLGERLLRAALVAVADPAPEAAGEAARAESAEAEAGGESPADEADAETGEAGGDKRAGA